MKILLSMVLSLVLLVSSGVAAFSQASVASSECCGGGEEAERLFQSAVNFENGVRGADFDPSEAMRLYQRAVDLGNAKAAINLGGMWHNSVGVEKVSPAKRLDTMNALYQKAVDLGCADGYFFLARSHDQGWGVSKNQAKAEALVRKGMEAGSLLCMADYGGRLCRKGESTEGLALLHKALDAGFAPAALDLGFAYRSLFFDYEKQIAALRQGAALGNKRCLYALYSVYTRGEERTGQPADQSYADCFYTLYKGIADYLPPQPIDLDAVCPAKPVKPASR